MWTTPEPAKSMAPESNRRLPLLISREALAQPSADHTQCDTIGYTKPAIVI
ncbi:hypothetical protein HanRHA438_Chr14g0635861 [Helianthus annuus]|uniref:Uncharacterized protein n=1 Tax=Helianthus annuus TaxID=4232 RepID=A0A9K3H520_HELAN|nr:hypothetical protein HanXRQr2_Chr14g0625911 [Helianthus annuus]KAJ0838935.1 hypothetical protein HanPSC8_Chr14g0600671 [Helianthus annuus]KAJ0852241.1 hypothetical protein HanRHA438_Chr14g0635861 [Helianthus annuus]